MGSQQRQMVLMISMVCFMLLPVQSWAGTVELPRTGQILSYDANTPQRDDGAIQAGAVWPDPRFTDNGDQTVKDNLTGLIWAKDAGTPAVAGTAICDGGAKETLQQALDYITCLNTNNYLYYNDWRLPNINELESLKDLSQHGPAMPANHPFANVSDFYWSSSTLAGSTRPGSAVRFFDYMYFAPIFEYGVWPLRGGECGQGLSVICLPKTGQTMSYASGDDGDLQTGVAWPSPRFTDNSTETVTDNLTGLEWTKNANAPGPTACGPGAYKTWQAALFYVACLNTNNYLGINDWRLPNINELESLVDFSQSNTALPAGHPFSNVQTSKGYWSSSTRTGNAYRALAVHAYSALLGYEGYKADFSYVWPVRNGQPVSLGISDISVSPNTMDFGNVNVGGTSSSQTFTIGNAGTSALVISSIGLTGADSDMFSIAAATCTSLSPTITAGSSCTITAIFSPTSAGSKSTTLRLISNDPDTANLDISLGGMGVEKTYTYAVAPQNKLFSYKSGTGIISVTASSSSCAWTASSDSVNWLTITSGSSGTGDGTVKYSATTNTSTTTRTGHITVGDQTFTVTQAGGTAMISVPSYLNIGNVKKDVASDTKTITVKNTGTANLEISDIAITGTNSSEFGYEKTGCDSVAPEGACTISVTLTATSYGSRSATLSLTSNGATKPTTVNLTGTAVPPKFSAPTSLGFTATSTSSTSAPKTLTIKNTGLSSLSVGDISITGANPSEFSPTNNCVQALAKNEACTVTVTFTPTAKGKRSATLNIASNDPKKTTATVKLSGRGK